MVLELMVSCSLIHLSYLYLLSLCFYNFSSAPDIFFFFPPFYLMGAFGSSKTAVVILKFTTESCTIMMLFIQSQK